MTLVEFLTARLDEDEAVAVFAAPSGRLARRSGKVPSGTDAHIARHDPARVLAEVDAKRRILERHEDPHEDCAGYIDDARENQEGCYTLRLLALPHADHADFDETWRP